MSIHIGIVWLGGKEWQGGRIYCENLLRVLSELQEKEGGLEVSIILDKPSELEEVADEFEETPKWYLQSFRKRLMKAFRKERKAYRSRRQENRAKKLKLRAVRLAGKKDGPIEPDRPVRPKEVDVYRALVEEGEFDFLFPLPANVDSTIPGAAWIPDFQHRFLPENFSEEELEARDRGCEKRGGMNHLIVSSETCLRDFRASFPEATADLHVWQFCSVVPESLFAAPADGSRERFHIPERFFVVPNQFWKHKDHLLVLDALALLAEEGIRPAMVFTGALKDNRGSGHIDRFLQQIQTNDLNAQTHLLGFLDRKDQQNLMRRALAVVHPSRFEGWSTVVEDCKSIGQRLVLSNLEVHLEQEPPNSIFFETGNARQLADAMKALLEEPEGEWEKQREARERAVAEAMREKRLEVARSFLRIAESSHSRNND